MPVSIIVAIIAVAIAGMSAFFAFTAANSSRKVTQVKLLLELNQRYQVLIASAALQRTWEEYSKVLKSELETEDVQDFTRQGVPIKKQSARKYNQKTLTGQSDKKIDNAVSDTFSYWHFIAKLVDDKLIAAEKALSFGGDPAILGFLFPLDNDWIQQNNIDAPKSKLESLYDHWIVLK